GAPVELPAQVARRQRTGRPRRVSGRRPQEVVQQGAVEHRLEPDLHRTDERARHGPAQALVAPVGVDLQHQVGPVAPPGRRFGDVVSFRRQVEGSWLDVTAKEFAGEVLAVAKGMAKAGIGRGDRVAIMSKTRYEWTLIDFAIWAAGAVTVPIYDTSSAEQVH